jgi:hypothetical protein
MSAGTGSSGAFSTSSVNNDWNYRVIIQNLTGNKPDTTIQIRLTDYYGLEVWTDLIFINYPVSDTYDSGWNPGGRKWAYFQLMDFYFETQP